MNMLAGMLSSVINKEQMTRDVIQDALEKVAQELNCSYKDFFLMIRPKDDEFNHAYFICKYDQNGLPIKVREITLKEILSASEE